MIERFLVRFRVDAILLCVYFSVPFIFPFFCLFFLLLHSSVKRQKAKEYICYLTIIVIVKNAGSVTVTIVVNDSYEFHFIVSLYNHYLSHVMRKPVYAICKQQRRRLACAYAQSDQRLCCWIISVVSISEISSLYLASLWLRRPV